MAKAQVKLPKTFIEKLAKLDDNFEPIVASCLECGGEIMLKETKAKLEKVLSGESSGELLSSLGLTKVRTSKSGVINIKVGFSEPRRDGSSNAMIANIIEYGKHNQPPRPFLKRAKSSGRKKTLQAMEERFDEEVNKL